MPTETTLPLGPVVVASTLSVAVTGDRWSLARMVRIEAENIGRLTVITKTVSPADDAATLVDAIRERSAVGAIFLAGVEADRAGQTQQAVADRGGPVVITDQGHHRDNRYRIVADRPGLAPGRSRVVITGAPTVPLLRLLAAGDRRNRQVGTPARGFRAETRQCPGTPTRYRSTTDTPQRRSAIRCPGWRGSVPHE